MNNGDKSYHRKYMHAGDEKQKLVPNILVQASRKNVRLSSLSGSLTHSPTDQTIMQGGVSLVLVCT